MKLSLLGLVASATASLAFGQLEIRANSSIYTNPILNQTAADPWVIRHGDYYYMTYTTGSNNLTLLRSSVLTDWNSAATKLILSPPPGLPYSTDIWAPELHQINNAWYIIFTATPDSDNPSPQDTMYCPYDCPALNHRMFVLENNASDPFSGSFSFKGMLDTYDQFAIDGTYFQHASGLYHVYSCWETAHAAWPSNLCITKLANPWTVSSNFSDRQVISTPSEPWEKTPYGRQLNDRLSSNEGPEQLVNNATGQNFIVYSAARSDNRNYCLGRLELVGPDPMNQQDWVKDTAGCVFYQNPMESAYGVGHASFTTSPDGSEDWIVYHGMLDPTDGWSARTIRTQRFGWNAGDGTPMFPRPGYGPYQVPSGQD